jgi:hypothetical protein
MLRTDPLMIGSKQRLDLDRVAPQAHAMDAAAEPAGDPLRVGPALG